MASTIRAAAAPGATNALPLRSNPTTSAPESRVRATRASSVAGSSVSGRPPALACESGMTISAPWLPSAAAQMRSARSTPVSATSAWKRAVSSTPAIPTTRWDGKPDARQACWVISSSGLVTTRITASGQAAATRVATSPTMAALVLTRSDRLIPAAGRGLR